SDPADTRRWIAVEATGLTGSLAVPSVTAAASGVHFDYNAASTGASRLDWAHAISGGPLTILLQPIDLPATTAFSIGGTLDTLDRNRATGGATVIGDWTVFGVTLPVFPTTGDYIDVAGTVDTISIGSFATASATFIDLQRLDGAVAPVGTGTLFKLRLDGASL